MAYDHGQHEAEMEQWRTSEEGQHEARRERYHAACYLTTVARESGLFTDAVMAGAADKHGELTDAFILLLDSELTRIHNEWAEVSAAYPDSGFAMPLTDLWVAWQEYQCEHEPYAVARAKRGSR